MYDNNLKVKAKSEAVPDMKKVLPYARRKVLENVKVVFSGVVKFASDTALCFEYLMAPININRFP